jgi:hypothetical protein
MEQKFADAIIASDVMEKERAAGFTDAEIQHITALRNTVFSEITRLAARLNPTFHQNTEVFLNKLETRDMYGGKVTPEPFKRERWVIAYHGKKYFFTYEIIFRSDSTDVYGGLEQFTQCIRDETTGLPTRFDVFDNPYQIGNSFYNPSILDRNGRLSDHPFRMTLKYD